MNMEENAIKNKITLKENEISKLKESNKKDINENNELDNKKKENSDRNEEDKIQITANALQDEGNQNSSKKKRGRKNL